MKSGRNRKRDSRLTGSGIRPFRSLSLLQFSVVIFIMAALVAMAIPVWSNIRKNAYEAKAKQNHERGEEAVQKYWAACGEKARSYKGLTPDYVDSTKPGALCNETNLAELERMGLEQIPIDYFSSILIIRDRNTPLDEISVAAIAQNGKVFFSHYKEADVIDSGVFAFSDLLSGKGERLQARAQTGGNSE